MSIVHNIWRRAVVALFGALATTVIVFTVWIYIDYLVVTRPLWYEGKVSQRNYPLFGLVATVAASVGACVGLLAGQWNVNRSIRASGLGSLVGVVVNVLICFGAQVVLPESLAQIVRERCIDIGTPVSLILGGAIGFMVGRRGVHAT